MKKYEGLVYTDTVRKMIDRDKENARDKKIFPIALTAAIGVLIVGIWQIL